MKKLERISKLGLRITWKLIDLGFRGSEIFRNELSAKDIIDFSILTMSNDQNADTDIVDLACEYEANVDDVNDHVKKLAQKENTEYSVEFRKWRVFYVLNHLPGPGVEFISGLIELGDIWAKLDFPSDSPHVFQGKNNTITPEQYYTQENYNALLHKHIDWVDKEIKQLETSI